nr:glycosyltransferase family 87 protein [uncultured Lichenicoccus sp.]
MSIRPGTWPVRGAHLGIVCASIVILFGFLSPYVLIKFLLLPRLPTNDYFAFYSFSRFIHDDPAASIYDLHLLERLQFRLHGDRFPFLYHPGMLLLIWPLALLPFGAGWVCWIGLGLLGYLVALGLRGHRVAALAGLVAPSTLWTTLCGQTALFSAALLFGGFRLLPRRPVGAGILFGLLTYKPQLAILVPLALVASSQWRCLLWTCLMGGLFMTASAAAFGIGVWMAWLHDLPNLAHLIARTTLLFCPVMATVTSNLLVFGVPTAAAHAIQAVMSVAACGAVWACLRQGVTMPGAAAVAVGTFLATPFAFGYDMPLLSGAVIVFVGDCHRRNSDLATWEVVILLAGFLLPCCIVFTQAFCLSSLVVSALLWLIVRRATASGRTTAGASAPGRMAQA